MGVLLTDVRSALATLLGEDAISEPWPAYRDASIQWALERIARMYEFDFGQNSFNVTTGPSGRYTFLAADGVRTDPHLDVRIVIAGPSNDYIFSPVQREEFDNYTIGSYVYYLDTAADGTQTLVTTEPNANLQVTASRVAPVISETVPTNFPSALAIAKGAIIYVREYEDKDTDVSVEDAKFRQIMQEIIGAEQRNDAPGRGKTRQELTGNYFGKVRSGFYSDGRY